METILATPKYAQGHIGYLNSRLNSDNSRLTPSGYAIKINVGFRLLFSCSQPY